MMTATTTKSIEQAVAGSDDRVAQQGAEKREAAVHPPKIQNILVAVDFSEYSRAALNYASFLAERFGATLTLVHAVEPYVYPEDLSAGFTLEEIDARWMAKQKGKLETLREFIAAHADLAADAFAGTLLETLAAWSGGRRAQTDDITLVVVDVVTS